MPREWRLQLEDLGRIATADVEIKPLTVLVGRNNSGKSYLASLVWGIESGALGVIEPDRGFVDAVRAWLQRSRDSGGQSARWSDAEQQSARDAWSTLVAASGDVLGRAIFGNERLRWKARSISSPGLDGPWYSAGGPVPSAGSESVWRGSFSTWDLTLKQPHPGLGDMLFSVGLLHLAGERPEARAQWARNLRLLLPTLAGYSVYPFLSAEYNPTMDPVFLPASRTGFALFLPTYIQSALTRSPDPAPIVNGGQGHASGATRFTSPQLHLLSALASGFGGEPGPFADEADRLERECLDGNIEAGGEFGVARYGFRPAGGERIGLPISSALVTELLPLIVALRNAQELPFLVLEEPEAHLHPRLQRAVIRCLARLVRRGVKVLITTHSATVAQQVNNLVKLGALDPDRRGAFGYGPDEYLSVDEVSVHEFVFREDGRTVVQPTKPQPSGFALPTFNEALQDIARETLALNAALEDEGLD